MKADFHGKKVYAHRRKHKIIAGYTFSHEIFTHYVYLYIRDPALYLVGSMQLMESAHCVETRFTRGEPSFSAKRSPITNYYVPNQLKMMLLYCFHFLQNKETDVSKCCHRRESRGKLPVIINMLPAICTQPGETASAVK